MSSLEITRLARKAGKTIPVQLALPFLCWAAGVGAVNATGIPLPPGVIGLCLMLALLHSGWLALPYVRRGAYWLLGEMMVFFVPAAMCVIDHPEFFGVLGVKLLAVLILGNFITLAVTATVVGYFIRREKARADV